MNVKKECSKCHKVKPFSEFHLRKSSKDGRQPRCKKCNNEISKKYYQEHREQRKDYYEKVVRKRMGHLPMCENKKCSSYLGVVIAERLCRHLFKDVEVMPYGNTAYDIVCNRGKKIDVKSSTMTLQHNKYPRWAFKINLNTTADYFILVAFDNRSDFNPLHMWMIPGSEVNKQTKASIRPSTLHKWSRWERDIKDAQLCCVEMKESELYSKVK